MNDLNKFTVGLIINPISGMGGSVGLKGTDGEKILKKAIELGAQPNAMNRTKEFLNELIPIKSKLKFVTCPKYMGASVLEEMGFDYLILDHPEFQEIEHYHDTNAQHTKTAATIMKEHKNLVIIIFVGGDGTARDMVEAINDEKPCLGIPAGVKIYSSVFSINPKTAASLIMQFLWEESALKESEVLDIDEEEYRKGKLVSKLHGYLLTPYIPDFIQSSKMSSPDNDSTNQERIARRIIEDFKKDVYYLIGPGTTTKAITDLLNQKKTVLGVDLLLNNRILMHDLNEQQILNQVNKKEAKIIVSPIGKQGFLFGRGNLQFTPDVLRIVGSKNIIIACTIYKLQNIPNQRLRLDTRDAALDEMMRGLYKVFVDYAQIKICKVE
ncbi:MAG: ATP-NAD kinase [Promethearchaeota archaeon]|nr:MAG: ATP-NAD kinase [Candidatus Lokiarchaeota archaeon]